MRILIVEDNIELAKQMSIQLEKEGHAVDRSYNATDAEIKSISNEYDLILLDLNLPDKSGLEALRFFKEEEATAAVIIVSARESSDEIVKGLEAGADDYIVKPYDFKVLLARIHAVQRRKLNLNTPLLEIGDLSLDIKKRIFYVKGKEIVLSAKEYQIIEYLMIASPRVVSAEELIEHIYDEDFNPFSSVLRVHIANLRKKINQDEKEYLVNLKGLGYRL